MIEKNRFHQQDKTNDTKRSSTQTTENGAAKKTIVPKDNNLVNTTGDQIDLCSNNEPLFWLDPEIKASMDFLANEFDD